MFRPPPLLLPLVLLSTPVQAQDAPTDPSVAVQFAEGQNAYLYGDYPIVIARLKPLIEPDILLSPDNAAEAYESLGLAYFFMNDEEHAREMFSQLVRLRPNWALDPVLVPPTAITFFSAVQDNLRAELEAQQQALETLRREEEERQLQARTREVRKEIRYNSRFVAAMPFGVGQFQNDQPILGASFLASELLTLGLSSGFFLSVEHLRQPSGRFASADYERAQKYQTAQLVSGGIAAGLMIVGIAHALLTFKEQKIINETVIEPQSIPSQRAAFRSSGLLNWEF